jgi:hypothetical protein
MKIYSSKKSAMTAANRAGYKAADVTVIDHTTGFSWHPKAPGVSLANPTYDAFLGAVQDAITDDMRSDAVAETADRALYIAATYGPADAPDCGEFETDLTDDQEAQAEAIIAANHEAKRQAEDEARDADAIETRPMLQLADIAGGDYGMVLADEADAAAQKIANDTGKPIGICNANGIVLRAATPGLTVLVPLMDDPAVSAGMNRMALPSPETQKLMLTPAAELLDPGMTVPIPLTDPDRAALISRLIAAGFDPADMDAPTELLMKLERKTATPAPAGHRLTSFTAIVSSVMAYDAAKALAKRLGVSVRYSHGTDAPVTIEPGTKPAAKPAGETVPRAGGRLTSPGRTDQIFIDLATRPQGVTAKETEAATGWKNPAPSQECARISARWGYSWTVDKTVRPAAYHLTQG